MLHARTMKQLLLFVLLLLILSSNPAYSDVNSVCLTANMANRDIYGFYDTPPQAGSAASAYASELDNAVVAGYFWDTHKWHCFSVTNNDSGEVVGIHAPCGSGGNTPG